ncbi:hypothetical protein BC834DRAFT_969435 [Gloeopeniophorella convolvens]|nr:hypothetical protein BC834DRAFT_969435 [Gloeopeniophorella convolvens]
MNANGGKPRHPLVARILGIVFALWEFFRPQPWVINNIKLRKSQKLLFRSWLASWGALIMMLPNNSLKTIGNLSYFGMLFSVFIPPMYPVQMYIITVVQSLFGLLVGWAVGCAGMRAALSVRSELLIESTLQKVANNFQGTVNPDQVYKLEVFQGDFLDPKSSVMFGVFMAIGAFILAFVRAYSPPFMIFTIFGTIALDIFCAVGPLYPFAQYEILNSVLISSSAYCAMALVCCFFLFPETVNHLYLNVISLILGKVKAMLASQDGILSPQPGDFGPGCPKLKALAGTRIALATMYQNLTGLKMYLESEFSFGRWSGDDLMAISDPVLAVIARINGLMSFVKHLRDLPAPPEAFADVPPPTTVSSDTHLLHHVFNPDIARESALKVTLLNVLPQVKGATAELRGATIEGVAAVQALVDHVNSDRVFNRPGPIGPVEERLDAAAEKLRQALDDFKENGTHAILGAYGQKPRADMPLRSLYLGYVFGSTTIVIGEVVLSLVQKSGEISARRKRVRVWGPSSVKHVLNALFKARRKSEERTFGEEEKNESFQDEEDDQEKEYHLDPDSQPPTNVIQKFMNVLHLILQWLKTPEALFVFRYILITILMWLPSVFKTTAHFYYVNKGIWSLIMAQTILTVYAGDQLYNYIIRISGTFLGLVMGLLIWYTGNANGNGTQYGFAASYAVLMTPVLFIRLFAPPQYMQGVILGTITVTLILGYSWIDGHLPVISNPGIGWHAAWRRWTLVMIGCGASFVVMMLPPKSGRKAVRLRAASSISALGHVYTALMSAWITESDAGKDESYTASGWVKSFRSRLVAVHLQIQAGKQMMMLASWEGNIRGRWQREEYVKMTQVQEEMIGVLSQLGGALWKLDTKWRISLLHHTKVVDPNFISDLVSVFSSVSQSLTTGEPMHTVLPQTLLDRLLLHHQVGAAATPELSTRSEIGPEEMQSVNHMYYTSAVVAVYQLMECLDELHAITRRLCGEVPLRGFEKWKYLHKSRRGTLSRADTAVEREPLISEKREGGVV